MKIKLEQSDIEKLAVKIADKMDMIGEIYNEFFDVCVSLYGIGMNVTGTYTVTKHRENKY